MLFPLGFRTVIVKQFKEIMKQDEKKKDRIIAVLNLERTGEVKNLSL